MEKSLHTQDSPSFVDLCTLHQYAMRYYRLWIYTCNTVLAGATLVFIIFAISVLIDPRISLLSEVELYQPTFLYAYLALLLQCGVLQTIGCLGALRLNQKLLNTYWTLLLILMIGDIFVGLWWAFRLDRIKTALKPNLRHRLKYDYGRDSHFTQVWDWVQEHDSCCGVDGPFDYPMYNETFYALNLSGTLSESSTIPRLPPIINLLPSTCCSFDRHNSTALPQSSTTVTRKLITPTQSPSHSTAGSSFRRIRPPKNPKTDSSSITHPTLLNSGPSISSSSFTNTGSSGAGPPPLGQHHTHSSSHYPSSTSQLSPNIRHYLHYVRSEAYPTLSPAHPAFFSTCYVGKEAFEKLEKLHREDDSDSNSGSSSSSSAEGQVSNDSPSSSSSRVVTPTLSKSKVFQSTDVLNDVIKQPTFSAGSTRTFSSREESSVTKDLVSSSSQVSSSSTISSQSQHYHHHQQQQTDGPIISLQDQMTPAYIDGIPLHQLLEKYKYVSHEHPEPCGQKVLDWLNRVTDILFVLGFCIIVFIKGCFLAILRYEIKEMIQKIKLLNGEDPALRSPTMNELIGLTTMNSGSGENIADENDQQQQPSQTGGPGGGGGGSGGATGGSANTTASGTSSNRFQRQKSMPHPDDVQETRLHVPDTIPNHVKHTQVNHVGGLPATTHDITVIDDDSCNYDDSSSALLPRSNNKAPPPPIAPRMYLKNNASSNNNTFSVPTIHRASSAPATNTTSGTSIP